MKNLNKKMNNYDERVVLFNMKIDNIIHKLIIYLSLNQKL